jgi:hypothetical protein
MIKTNSPFGGSYSLRALNPGKMGSMFGPIEEVVPLPSVPEEPRTQAEMYCFGGMWGGVARLKKRTTRPDMAADEKKKQQKPTRHTECFEEESDGTTTARIC